MNFILAAVVVLTDLLQCLKCLLNSDNFTFFFSVDYSETLQTITMSRERNHYILYLHDQNKQK
jgi:hypothetical protein